MEGTCKGCGAEGVELNDAGLCTNCQAKKADTPAEGGGDAPAEGGDAPAEGGDAPAEGGGDAPAAK